MPTTNPIYSLIVAAKSGTSNARRVARAIGVTSDEVWATADVAWERGELAASRALAAIASDFAVPA